MGNTLLDYALIQVFHNFGAVLILALSSRGLVMARRQQSTRWIAGLTGLVWALQGITGALFGWVTWKTEHQWPDIHGVAVAALIIKMLCVVAGILSMGAGALWGMRWSCERQLGFWATGLGLGALALTCAAFLRWFS